MFRDSFLMVVLVLSLQSVLISCATFPDNPPNDPDYDRWEMGESGTSFYNEQWNLFSFTPRGVWLIKEASGISADLAWQITTGRKDVIIAILDSGIDWGERDLVNQFYLNEGELPEPQDAAGHSKSGVFDVNGDGLQEIINGSGGYILRAFNHLGQEPRGWPKFTGHWLAASPAVGDIEGDDLLEVVINTWEGQLFVWDTDGPIQVGGHSSIQWQKFNYDQWNTGNFSSPLPVD